MKHRVSDIEYEQLKQWTQSFINDVCIVRNTKMPAKKAGDWYTWMFYLRRGLFNHRFLSAVSQMFIYKMERIDPDLNFQISGLETAATPMLAGIPLIARVYGDDINSFVVRQERKKYGLLNTIEGLPNSKPVLMLDDLCNSSASLSKCYKELLELKHEVCDTAFVLVNKSNEEVHTAERLNSDMYLPPHIKVISLFTLDDFNLSNPSH
jgi:orotate phosphoribosyltransferase